MVATAVTGDRAEDVGATIERYRREQAEVEFAARVERLGDRYRCPVEFVRRNEAFRKMKVCTDVDRTVWLDAGGVIGPLSQAHFDRIVKAADPMREWWTIERERYRSESGFAMVHLVLAVGCGLALADFAPGLFGPITAQRAGRAMMGLVFLVAGGATVVSGVRKVLAFRVRSFEQFVADVERRVERRAKRGV